MLRACMIDFKGNWDDYLPLIEFTYNNSYHSSIGMAPFEALYCRRCRYPIGWFEVGEVALIGPELVHEAIEKVRLIKERLRTAKSHQKSYADVRRRDLEFDVLDWVYLIISPMKGVMRFGKKGKVSPCFVGPYQILRRVGKVAYELGFPNELVSMHPVFYVSMLKKCVGDSTSIILLEGLEVKENFSYEEVPDEIIDRQVKRLRNKEVASVKVLWRNHLVEGATWEAEVDMMSRHGRGKGPTVPLILIKEHIHPKPTRRGEDWSPKSVGNPPSATLSPSGLSRKPKMMDNWVIHIGARRSGWRISKGAPSPPKWYTSGGTSYWKFQ
ncbi:hypothetical protein MTR67_012330 [Solanum verrucosum]|uniref:Tf2-1-like SH3-like domain-containing protein n=1 Tax=Solanum verrucosum TaxID=315347 RepID=A0AAF0QCT4_SOLVR|nr:hypothetical protein MTR67_012330 [Solanum verrucosum]